MLKLIDIQKLYKVEEEVTVALGGVSIEFRQNEFVSILGPSGCGKTTLLNIIGGLDRYSSGDIQVEGVSTKDYDDVDWDTYRNRRIGFVFQSYNLIPHLNVLKNVAMSLTLAGVDRDERKKRALDALRLVGLESQARKKPNQLSGGQMQRVAIARALVNNPEIILADEPTGALDTESGIQVMDILKEVAKDRLVIMVTHNPDLAQKYSTRIVYLKDGKIVGDTMPYDSALDSAMPSETIPDSQPEQNEIAASDNGEKKSLLKMFKAGGKKLSLKDRLKKRRSMGKSAMKLSTAISLSWNNLISKKGRTLLTSIAGSIGIIGIVLVLALSTGARAYINGLEESALSSYPITVNQTSMGISEILTKMMTSMSESDLKVEDDVIKVQEVLGNLVSELGNMLSASQNDLHTFKKYIEANFDKNLADVKYNYGITFNCYAEDRGESAEAQNRYMKINPYTETMQAVLTQVTHMPVIGPMLENMTINIMGQEKGFFDAIDMLTGMLGSAWSEMSSNMDMLESQYELVTNRSHWPTHENEIVIVVDENNRLMDFQLFMLGLQSQDEVMSAIGNGAEFSSKSYDVDEILNLEYKVMNNVDYLEESTAEPETWIMHPRSEQNRDYVDEHCVKFSDGSDHLKVSGIVRPKKGAVASSISGIIGYTSQLTQYLFDQAKNHPAVQEINRRFEEAQAAGERDYLSPITYYVNPDGSDKKESETGKDVKIGDIIDYADNLGGVSHESDHFTILRQLGIADMEYPQSIDFYCSSFDSKHGVEQFIERYKAESGNNLTYTDGLSTMMGFIDTMATTITGVLIAFAAISLIVSTIMIAIIIYTSVLERRKEIGVLRSIGARKKDISRVFIAESAILGSYSGVIGIAVSFALSILISMLLKMLFGISGLVSVQWWHCVLMLGISVLLSVLAGFVPSRIAANKDPAIALRSE